MASMKHEGKALAALTLPAKYMQAEQHLIDKGDETVKRCKEYGYSIIINAFPLTTGGQGSTGSLVRV